ncbi:MAG TPA: hypothetical protein VFC24_16545 [Casimicrobiaceae bacterium]|nr:hypothetical protein [Casimicrobiaceae bacterium]
MLALLVGGCATRPTTTSSPIPTTPPAEVRDAPVARVPVAPPPVAVAPVTAPVPSTAAPPIAVALPFPVNVIYMCVTEDGGQRKQTAIEFVPKVLDLCRRHPEMGPCQYEREICRRAGGRVFAADGAEITRRTEEEYDKRVYRVRFRAN